MCCTISAFVEVVAQGGGHASLVCQREISSNYELFALMADVQNIPERAIKVPVSPPKGLPEDVSEAVTNEADGDCDIHSFSWLSLEELKEVQRRYTALIEEPVSCFQSENEIIPAGARVSKTIDVLGNPQLHVAVGNPRPLGEDRQLAAIIELMESLANGHQEPRLVFWFDN